MPNGSASLPVVFDPAAPFHLPGAADAAAQLELPQLCDALDLARPGLDKVRQAHQAGDEQAALTHLLDYYRQRPPLTGLDVITPLTTGQSAIATDQWAPQAQQVLKHLILPRPSFAEMGYPAHDYGEKIDWSFNQNDDVSWSACMQRFDWDAPLAGAYQLQRDSRYVQCWAELTADFIANHRLAAVRAEKWLRFGQGKQFAFNALNSGVRARRWCGDFELYKNDPAFTPQFLGQLLLGVHDIASRNAYWPEPTHHNFTIVQISGLMHLAITFAEFREAPFWMERALSLLEETLAIQVSADGVQREWSINYHLACAPQLQAILETAQASGQTPRPQLLKVVEKMYDYMVAAISPDRQYPMFSDARRPGHNLAAALAHGHRAFPKPEYLAVMAERPEGYPKQLSYHFPESGFYYLRSNWERGGAYLALHCSPPAQSSHDQPDNGTFEIHAHGRWLMPDSGCYAYSHGTEFAKDRPWFCKGSSHQTLTLNDARIANASQHLLWIDQPGYTVLACSNDSSPGFTHRRTIWFVERSFFVLLDEALGDQVQGDLRLHFQLAPGPARLDLPGKTARTDFPEGGNLLLWALPDDNVEMIAEEGWTSAQFHVKERRPALALRIAEAHGPACFVTVLVPYAGQDVPAVTARWLRAFDAGDAAAELEVELDGRRWRLSRDLAGKSAGVFP